VSSARRGCASGVTALRLTLSILLEDTTDEGSMGSLWDAVDDADQACMRRYIFTTRRGWCRWGDVGVSWC
jgi:hypothetical protein